MTRHRGLKQNSFELIHLLSISINKPMTRHRGLKHLIQKLHKVLLLDQQTHDPTQGIKTKFNLSSFQSF